MDIDWKDALSALRESGTLPEGELPAPAEKPEPARRDFVKLAFAMERKGRGGKTATIISGFTCSDDRLQEIARMLKQKIGTGGSARGGEILLQGDWRDKAREILLGR